MTNVVRPAKKKKKVEKGYPRSSSDVCVVRPGRVSFTVPGGGDAAELRPCFK